MLTCYSPVRRSSTPKGLSARLACVKHAASVRPEPGSNSPTKTWKIKPGIIKCQGITNQKPPPTWQKLAGNQTNFGTGLSSTLLSSQRTNTHQQNHPHQAGNPTRAIRPTRLPPGNFSTLPGRLRVVKNYFQFLSHRPSFPALHQTAWRSVGRGVRQTGPLRHPKLGPAPCRLPTLPGWFRNLKSGFPASSTTRLSLVRRSPAPSWRLRFRLFCPCPACREKVTRLPPGTQVDLARLWLGVHMPSSEPADRLSRALDQVQ